ncbi:MAG: PqqD family protein [Peptococcaceae bacterium]|nr:PqqD family protein [Peptococcaceae bacterium]
MYKLNSNFKVDYVGSQIYLRSNSSINGQAVLLNESSQLIVKLLEIGADINQLAQALAKEYALELQDAKSDILDFVQELMGAGLVEALD